MSEQETENTETAVTDSETTDTGSVEEPVTVDSSGEDLAAEEQSEDASETSDPYAHVPDEFKSSSKATEQVLYIYGQVKERVENTKGSNLFEATPDLVLGLTKMALDQSVINEQNDLLNRRMELADQFSRKQEAQARFQGGGIPVL